MKIGELAEKTGCKVVTIRYYEKKGLLTRPPRSKGNYRLYNEADLERLEFILHCRKHEMQLDEIKKLLEFRDHPQRDCTWVSELLSSQIEDINAKIHSLQQLKKQLKNLRSRCDGGHDGETCAIMQGLDDKESCCAVEDDLLKLLGSHKH